MKTKVVPAIWNRPTSGSLWKPETLSHDLPIHGGRGWQSNGGATKGHLARTMPHSIEVGIPDERGQLIRVFLVGVFALHAGPAEEPEGGMGASIQIEDFRKRALFRQSMVYGLHYLDATALDPIEQLNGDGTGLETIDKTEINGQPCRIDLLSIDLPEMERGQVFRFRDLGTPASFILFDILFEFDLRAGCPFGEYSPGVSLGDLGSAVRVGDRVKFAAALQQLGTSIERVRDDLDEARGLALTFLAVICAALLETGATREIHRVQLDAARTLLGLGTVAEIVRFTDESANDLVRDLMRRESATGDPLIDRALKIVDRNFSKELVDSEVSHQLGLSTSHFRFLFRQATGQPFHRYVLAVRLEKARQLLLEQAMPVSDVAKHVGFVSAAHFTRAFQKRFSVLPSVVRQVHR